MRRVGDRKKQHGSTIWHQLQKAGRYTLTPMGWYRKNRRKATGILVVDAKVIKIKGKEKHEHMAYDTGIGLIDSFLDDAESSMAYGYILRRLDDEGYIPIIAVSDGSSGFESALKKHSKKIAHQRCIVHLMRDFRRILNIKRGERSRRTLLISRIRHVYFSDTIEELSNNLRFFQRIVQKLFTKPNETRVLKLFWKTIEQATLHLSFIPGGIPRTTNMLEGFIGRVNTRLKTMRGLKSEKSARNLLNLIYASLRKK